MLPTAGCACHSSGLSVRAFCKNVQVVTYDESALRAVVGHVVALADAEDLPNHGAAVRLRVAATSDEPAAPDGGAADDTAAVTGTA